MYWEQAVTNLNILNDSFGQWSKLPLWLRVIRIILLMLLAKLVAVHGLLCVSQWACRQFNFFFTDGRYLRSEDKFGIAARILQARKYSNSTAGKTHVDLLAISPCSTMPLMHTSVSLASTVACSAESTLSATVCPFLWILFLLTGGYR